MADLIPEAAPPAALPAGPAASKRVHSYSRFTTAVAVLGLATALYALLRLDSLRDRVDQISDVARQSQAERESLRADLGALAAQQQLHRNELTRTINSLASMPKQVQELSTAVEELHGKTDGPQRAWSRAEALYLMEIAQRSLALHRDVDTAVTALESADSRLASLRDAGLAPVRQQLVRDVQALRSVAMPDVTGIVARLASAEELADRAAVKGAIAVERTADRNKALPEGFLARSRAVVSNALSALISVRRIDDQAGNVVTFDEQMVRRQHLQLLLFTARSAVARHDEAMYRTALASARRWLGEFFDLAEPAGRTLLDEIQALEPIRIDPRLPDITASAKLLQKLSPGARPVA